MLTVKIIDVDGSETVIESKQVLKCPTHPDDSSAVTLGKSWDLCIDVEDDQLRYGLNRSHTGAPGCGRIFVMNGNGATVATYEL